MTERLTPGSVSQINASAAGVSVTGCNHCVQITATKILPDSSGNERYRVTVVDGRETMFCILSTSLSKMVINSEIIEGSVIQITSFTLNQNGTNK